MFLKYYIKNLHKLLETNRISLLTSSSIFIAFNGLLVTLISFLLYNIPIDPILLTSSFLVTLSAYSFNKITDTAEDRLNNPDRLALINKNKRFWVQISFTSLTLSLLIGALKNLLTIPILLTPFIIALFYSFKFSPSLPRLKEVFCVKSIVVATNWALVATLLPITVGSFNLSTMFFIFSFIFITIFVNTVLFDVKDIEGDRAAGIRTIPIVLGIERTKWLLLSVNSVLIFYLFFSLILNGFFIYLPALAFSVFYSFLLIGIFCKKKLEIPLLQELLIDGEWIPLVLLLAIISLFV